ncbi:MAG TPA: hypothetical protein VK179_12410 [Bacteroidales bacterium]|nr:hypothetical protein [Bacteroidales bacterium]
MERFRNSILLRIFFILVIIPLSFRPAYSQEISDKSANLKNLCFENNHFNADFNSTNPNERTLSHSVLNLVKGHGYQHQSPLYSNLPLHYYFCKNQTPETKHTIYPCLDLICVLLI